MRLSLEIFIGKICQLYSKRVKIARQLLWEEEMLLKKTVLFLFLAGVSEKVGSLCKDNCMIMGITIILAAEIH